MNTGTETFKNCCNSCKKGGKITSAIFPYLFQSLIPEFMLIY